LFYGSFIPAEAVTTAIWSSTPRLIPRSMLRFEQTS